MAVYTKISENKLISLLKKYNIGNLKSYKGIVEGVENTNYKIITSKNKFILTIFEKRVEKKDLPFFITLQKFLSKKKIRCPNPIADKKNKFINKIENKNCVIMSFLEGKKIINPDIKHCKQIGFELARMHESTKNFKGKRKNSLHFSSWQKILEKCKKSPFLNKKIPQKNHPSINKYSDYFDPIQKELDFLKKNWPKNLPKGIIHADVFKDNVFFINGSLTGLIDFYFACNDFYAYELAICVNDWCFKNFKTFETKKYLSFLKSYQKKRKLTKQEIKNMSTLLRGAAIRFLLTRLHDQLYHPKDAIVKQKNPLDYFHILETHKKIQESKKGYGI